METLPVGQRKGKCGNISTWLRAALPCSLSCPSLYIDTRGVSVFHHYCALGKRILWKLNIFAKKLLFLGASDGNIHESRIMVKDKTKTCQKQETNFLYASGCTNMYDVHEMHPKGYNFYRKSNVFMLYPSLC